MWQTRGVPSHARPQRHFRWRNGRFAPYRSLRQRNRSIPHKHRRGQSSLKDDAELENPNEDVATKLPEIESLDPDAYQCYAFRRSHLGCCETRYGPTTAKDRARSGCCLRRFGQMSTEHKQACISDRRYASIIALIMPIGMRPKSTHGCGSIGLAGRLELF